MIAGASAIFSVWATSALAADHELRSLYRSTRAMALGGAYVAITDDADALYLNPAGLAGIKGQQIQYAILDAELSQDALTSSTLLSTFSNANGTAVNALLGKNIYGRAQVTPTFVMPGFGVGIILDGQAAVLANNTALPDIIAGYQTTMGIQAGFGFSVLKKGRRASPTAPDLRVGLGAKMLWRRGGYRPLGLTSLLNITPELLKSMAGNFGRGLGFDLGMQYLMPLNSRLTLQFGGAMTEIGDVKFASEADTQRGNFTVGTALRYRLPRSEITLAYDYAHISEDTDWRKRSNLGLEAKLPFVSLMLGLHQMRLTYGASFDAWIFKVTAVSYSEEIGTTWGLDPERRFMLRLALGFGI